MMSLLKLGIHWMLLLHTISVADAIRIAVESFHQSCLVYLRGMTLIKLLEVYCMICLAKYNQELNVSSSLSLFMSL